MTSDQRVLLATDGAFVNEAEIRNADGSHLKIKLRGERVIVRLLDRGSRNAPGHSYRVVPPGTLPIPTTTPTLMLLGSPFVAGKSSVSVSVQVTWSLSLLVSVRLKAILGDITEEYAYRRKRLSESKALVWLLTQIVCSIVPVVWQLLRYDFKEGMSAWRLWRSY